MRWFPGAQLNFAENLLRYQDDEPAIIAWNEDLERREISHADLYRAVSRLAAAMRAFGIKQGDRVAGYMPNVPETVIAMLATASLGAIWSSSSPDFGVPGVLDRFAQIEPKLIIAADGYAYNGKPVDALANLREIVSQLPSLKGVVVVPLRQRNPDIRGIPHALRLEDFVAFQPPGTIQFEPLPFEHPLYILYSSGTTGLPKCLVHGAGGTLLQHLKELVLHTDLKPHDRIFYQTTCGWMMWNWLVSSLATGACIVLWDGSPLYPRKDIFWEIAARERISIFGTNPKYLSLLAKDRVTPRESHDLSSIETILSTGSPLLPEGFDYVYSKVHPKARLSSISGGTDIVSCFALGNPIAPVWRGELQCPGLGMNVEVFNEVGQAVIAEKGELVCHPPFPSMPLYFWNDPDGAKYESSYFEKYSGVWRHGDWAEVTVHGGLIIHGRSDTTLNPGGIRIGTAEIYRPVEQVDEVVESLVIGRAVDGDVQIVLFVKLKEGVVLSDDLRDKIRGHIRRSASPHHVPKWIVQVPELPRTVSGKITEIAVREIIHGRPVKNVNVLTNPEALDGFREAWRDTTKERT